VVHIRPGSSKTRRFLTNGTTPIKVRTYVLDHAQRVLAPRETLPPTGLASSWAGCEWSVTERPDRRSSVVPRHRPERTVPRAVCRYGPERTARPRPSRREGPRIGVPVPGCGHAFPVDVDDRIAAGQGERLAPAGVPVFVGPALDEALGGRPVDGIARADSLDGLDFARDID